MLPLQEIKKINDVNYAVRFALERLGKQSKTINITNYNRHAIVHCTDGECIYVLFKRESFLTWPYHFPQLTKRKDIERVESINLLNSVGEPVFYSSQDVCGKNGRIVLVYEDRSVYSISFHEWISRANRYGLYRTIQRLKFGKNFNFSGSDINIQEKTISCYLTKEEKLGK